VAAAWGPLDWRLQAALTVGLGAIAAPGAADRVIAELAKAVAKLDPDNRPAFIFAMAAGARADERLVPIVLPLWRTTGSDRNVCGNVIAQFGARADVRAVAAEMLDDRDEHHVMVARQVFAYAGELDARFGAAFDAAIRKTDKASARLVAALLEVCIDVPAAARDRDRVRAMCRATLGGKLRPTALRVLLTSLRDDDDAARLLAKELPAFKRAAMLEPWDIAAALGAWTLPVAVELLASRLAATKQVDRREEIVAALRRIGTPAALAVMAPGGTPARSADRTSARRSR
jgi:hypothetical protein